MTKVTKAEEEFYSGIRQRDEVNTRTAFEQAQKDTVEYFRAGILLYSKQAARSADQFSSQR